MELEDRHFYKRAASTFTDEDSSRCAQPHWSCRPAGGFYCAEVYGLTSDRGPYKSRRIFEDGECCSFFQIRSVAPVMTSYQTCSDCAFGHPMWTFW